jgi:predicted nucleic acid-binding protein
LTREICIDANLVVKWYTFEPYREQAVDLLDEAEQNGITIVAPDSIMPEVGSALRRGVHRGTITPEKGFMAISLLNRAPIKRFDVKDLFADAWRIAERYKLATLYDAYYLALAELRSCDFWTADERFINSVQGISYVRNIADFSPGRL